MKLSRLPYSVFGHFVTALLMGVQMMGLPGCSTALNSGPYDPDNPVGLFANDDTSSDTLGAVRLPTGETVFVFGDYGSNGAIREITGAILRDSSGQEAWAIFDNGLVQSAGSFDGSTVDMTYDEVSTRRIKGRADFSFAGLAEEDREQAATFDIDLEQAADQLADKVRDLLGVDISNSEPPDDPLAKSKQVEEAAGIKSEVRSQLILLFHAAAFAALGYVFVEIMAALVSVVFEVMVNVVSALTQAVVVAMFTPFILLGEVMRLSIEQPLYQVDINVDLDLDLPRHPR